MKKDFETRFMPNVKFIFTNLFDENLKFKIRHLMYDICGDRRDCYGFLISTHGTAITPVNEPDFNMSNLIQVSVFEAMPEFIPDGMRYNKELDKLVPDVISASDEDCSGIKDELEKVMDYADKKENNPIEPNHYTEMKISPLEYIEANQGDFTWCIANVIKYVSRHKRKNGIEDLKKAQWYLNHEINRLEIIEGMTNAK